MVENKEKKDIWSEWLKRRRFGDASHQAYAMEQYKKIAIEIVEKAKIFESAKVLDIGSGDGLVGLTALPKLGDNGKLILSDISEAALAIPKEIFNEENIQDKRVEFLVARVENLSAIQDCSIDRVLIRSVLLYVDDKQTAFKEIYRVLKTGGRVAIMEPINQRMVEFQMGLFRGYSLESEPLLSIKSLISKITEKSRSKGEESLLGYDEHDLVKLATKAGFAEINLEYTLSRTSHSGYPSWEFFFDSAPNPHARSLHEIMSDTLSLEEFKRVESIFKNVIQQPAIRLLSLAMLILEK